MCGLLRSTRNMQVRSDRQRHGWPGLAVYHLTRRQRGPTEIIRVPASNTRDNLPNNSTQCRECCCFELRGTNPSKLLFFCFFAPHRQPVAVHSVALYSSLVLQQSLLIISALASYLHLLISLRASAPLVSVSAASCATTVLPATCAAAPALPLLLPVLLQVLPVLLVTMLLLLRILLLQPLVQRPLLLSLLLQLAGALL